MIEGINEVAVLVTTLLTIAVGSVWYSPAVFGRAWMRSIGMSEVEMDAGKEQMMRLFVLAALISLSTMLVLAFSLKHFPVPVYSLAAAYTAIAGLFVAGAAVWEQRDFTYVLIVVGYIAAIIFGGFSVLAYWPW